MASYDFLYAPIERSRWELSIGIVLNIAQILLENPNESLSSLDALFTKKMRESNRVHARSRCKKRVFVVVDKHTALI